MADRAYVLVAEAQLDAIRLQYAAITAERVLLPSVWRAGGRNPPHGKFGEFYSDDNPHPNPAIQALHMAATKAQREQGLPSEVKPGQEKPINDVAKPDHWMTAAERVQHAQATYGDHQLSAILSKMTSGTLADAASTLGVSPGRSKADTISRITAHMTQGRYSGNFGPPQKAAGTPKAAKATVSAAAHQKLQQDHALLKADYAALKAASAKQAKALNAQITKLQAQVAKLQTKSGTKAKGG